MTTIHAQAERKRQDRSVCRAEKRLCRARMLRVRGLIHPTSAVCATTDTARGEKRLPSEQKAGDLEVKRQATWGMSVAGVEMADVRPGAGTLLTKYLLGLILTVIGLAIVLYGVFNSASMTTLLGFVIAAVGILLVVLKIMARNRPPA